jgi:pimeloyl-ACP methyl ester carboxylesterase
MPEGIAEVNNINIWWEDFGNPSDPSVLLIMGATANCMQWPPEFIDPLVDAGFHVVRFDNRDVGKSTWFGKESFSAKLVRLFLPKFLLKFFLKKAFNSIIDENGYMQEFDIKDPDYTLDDMAKDAVCLMDHLKIEKAHIIGASMGGMITQLLALDYPDRTLTITLIFSSPGMGDPDLSNMTPALVMGLQESAFMDAKGNHADSVTRIYRELTGSRFPFNEEKFREKLIPIMAHGHNPNCKHGEAAGASPSRKHRLNQISKPTLVIHGTEDAILGLDHGMALYENIPNAKKLIMEGVGHEIPEELADEISSTIFDHLNDSRSIA